LTEFVAWLQANGYAATSRYGELSVEDGELKVDRNCHRSRG
jgi:hypothetical protein